jgi:L-ribulose-5-phosphate 3-epimerase UlaE
MNTVEKAMHFVNKINSPYLQVYPDLGNITNAAVFCKHTVQKDLLTGAGHIAAMHLKETVPGKYREIPYGTGHVDFTQGIKTVSRMGVNLFVGEFWHVSSDWQAQLVFSNNFLRPKIELGIL